MNLPEALKDDPAAYKRSHFMTIPYRGGLISYYHVLDEDGYLPIEYQSHDARGEDNKTGWKIHCCDDLFRTWAEVVEYWPIHNSKMMEKSA